MGRDWTEDEHISRAAAPLPIRPEEGERSAGHPEEDERSEAVSKDPVSKDVVSRAGAQARIEPRDGGAEAIVVRDRAGKLLFEHDPVTGKSVIHAMGDLEIRADHGSVSISARDAVKLRGEREVEVQTPSLVATATRADVTIVDGRLVARSIRTVAEETRHAVKRLTVEAERIVERSKDVYRDVEGLAQTRAGRMRQVVESTFHVLSQRTVLKAEEDLKLKGSKIHIA